MNSTAKYSSNTSAKVDTLFSSFNKFILENYEPSEVEHAKYQQEWEDLKRNLQASNMTELLAGSGKNPRNDTGRNEHLSTMSA
jgi:hypothetical protein